MSEVLFGFSINEYSNYKDVGCFKINEGVALHDILPKGMTTQIVLNNLHKRMTQITGGKSAQERGAYICAHFPSIAQDTIRIANESLCGMMVLPGTGSQLHFVGNPPKWSENPVNDNEYTFHLNRMHHWKTMCEAYSLTGDIRYAQKTIDEMLNWIDTVPCPMLKDEQANYLVKSFEGLAIWRALEVGIRGYRTWPLVIELLIDTPLINTAFLEKLLPCVYLHCRVLYEIAPLLWPKADHNHYLMENLGLLSFACMFPELDSNEVWKRHALHELERCIDAQVTTCGGQIEGCPSYHNGCVFWFAMKQVLAHKYNLPVSDHYKSQLRKMFAHSVHATRACGGNFPWGDSHIADKETMCLGATACYMAFEETEYLACALAFYPKETLLNDIRENLWRISDLDKLGKSLQEAQENPKIPTLPLMECQKDLNQVYMRTAWDKNALSLMTACRTPVQNLHAHMDCGGFDFTAYGEPLVSDPGIYTYKDDENRYAFKSSMSHNCLTINGKDMWEYGGSWSYGVQQEGSVLSTHQTKRMMSVISQHHNYKPAIATRALALIDKRFVLVLDVVTQLDQDDIVQVNFHIDRTVLHEEDDCIRSLQPNSANIELTACGFESICIEDAKISTINDVWHSSKIVRFIKQIKQSGEFVHATLLVPHISGDMNRATQKLDVECKNGNIDITFTVDDIHYSLNFAKEKLTLL